MHDQDDDHDHDHDHDHGHRHGPPPDRSSSRLGRVLLAGLALLLAVVIVGRCGFFVDETEYVYVTQFGEPVRFCPQAGLHLKWPYQSLWRFDRRLQLYEPPAREMLTEDKENLNFDWYVCWRLPSLGLLAKQRGGQAAAEEQLAAYVRRFLQTVGDPATAENRLEERIQAALAAEIGHTKLDQLVTLKPGALELDALAQHVTAVIRTAALEQFGIEVVDVRLKRFNYPEAVKPAVFAEIRSEREGVAVQHRAEGASQKMKIESLATLERDQLLAQAKREATRVRGEGEAKAIEIFNAAHRKDPQFYELLKTLETYRLMLDDQTTIVLSADSPLLKLLTQGLPSPKSEGVPAESPSKPAGKAAPLSADAAPKSPPRQERTP
jgi:modulator of FtsH protease HflC